MDTKILYFFLFSYMIHTLHNELGGFGVNLEVKLVFWRFNLEIQFGKSDFYWLCESMNPKVFEWHSRHQHYITLRQKLQKVYKAF